MAEKLTTHQKRKVDFFESLDNRLFKSKVKPSPHGHLYGATLRSCSKLLSKQNDTNGPIRGLFAYKQVTYKKISVVKSLDKWIFRELFLFSVYTASIR